MSIRGAVKTRLLGLSRRATACMVRLARARRGGVAMITALAMPPLMLVGLGAFQLQAVFNDRQVTQDIADAAALWGAQQLTIAPSGVEPRTVAFADIQLVKVKANATVNTAATVSGKSTIRVVIETHRDSFFMNLMPVGGFNTRVEAIAEGASLSPLCVLVLGTSGGDELYMKDSSKLQAPACLIHSNKAVRADGSALIQGETVEAVTTASGPINPQAATGAPPIDDPFSSLSLNFPSLLMPCASILNMNINTSRSLAPTTSPVSIHQFKYKVDNGATLTLQPGEHYFCSDLELAGGAKLVGDDVVLIMAPGASLKWKDGGDVNLNGRKSGSFAGFVIIASRFEQNAVKIESDPISNITGAIYVPNADLEVDGDKQAGAGSAWTVLAAKSFLGRNSANLLINADYAGTDVPVPGGVGNKTGVTRLTR